MSEVIVRMDMPTRCGECDIAQKTKSGLRCPIASKLRGFSCVVGIGQLGRPHYCPIHVVLPEQHDDLIDRNDAIKEFELYAEYESNRSNAEWVERIKTVLNSMTCVIAAERKDDELPC